MARWSMKVSQAAGLMKKAEASLHQSALRVRRALDQYEGSRQAYETARAQLFSIEQAAAQIPELREVMQLLERARHGIEFFGLSQQAQQHWDDIKAARGVRRLGLFLGFLADLAQCTDYRLLSSVQMQGAQGADGDAQVDQINGIVNRITNNMTEQLSMADLAAELGMSESRFSRFFRRSTGNSFTDFVNRVRINSACHLLMQTDHYVTDICYQVGFNNVANFNRRFLEIKGMTPSEFRRQADTRFGNGMA